MIAHPKKSGMYYVLCIMGFLCIILTTFYILPIVHADEIDDLGKQIKELSEARELSVKATKPLEGQLAGLERQLAQIQATIDGLSASITQKQKDLDIREDKIALQQALLEQRVKAYYIRSFLTDPLTVILSSIGAGDLFRELSYRQSVTREDRQIIVSITSEVIDLLTEKTKLEKDKTRLALLQAEVDKNAAFLGGEIKKAKAYQADLTGKIAQLSARQQELLAAKLGSLNLPKSAYSMKGGCTDDRSIDPGFAPRFAMFSYGVPNRVGLNQFGAKGRAEAGQNAESILKAYYNADYTTGYNQGINIHVRGTNEYGQSFDEALNIEDYVKHLYEMPAGWPMEALKAQAIAARSYALAYTNNGSGPICPSQQCQVVKKEINDGNWQAAVEATRGVVMTSGGQPIKAWYSSTHGGYIFNSGDIGWSSTAFTKRAQDTTGGIGSFADLQNNAYDKNSPIFYCDWGSRAQYNKTAWLKPEELADIVNVLMLAKKDSSTQVHLSQIDKPNPDGQETWDANRVKSELGSRAFNSISDVSVSADFGSGRTSSVTVSGDGKSESFSGSEFKDYFNLRAPSNINIVGPLFNVEKR
ncbi:SpoIID/LytB domain-containing protein [Candidatus Daviesbacteria bacterium]|nr:SpoIID/LytB domain-containing protein [Candidatus Daviesbacteria bacterium]